MTHIENQRRSVFQSGVVLRILLREKTSPGAAQAIAHQIAVEIIIVPEVVWQTESMALSHAIKRLAMTMLRN